MNAEHFRRVAALYQSACERTAEERAALLAAADPELRREVESLLAQRGGEFLERPAIQNAPELLEEPTLDGLPAGSTLGPYRIEGKLGAGGMGDVYRAVDTRLGRAVAIKIAQKQFVQRFEREARAISSLNHPHICTLYDVGPNYLVMELVEGETIAARLKRESYSVATALVHVSQILAAVAEAHEKGIIHRDLKPGNIMIAKSGIKVLDFGLAKSGQDETLTASHMIIGTPAYMAPEQREGQLADARSDIYSFGCVLYEMLTRARVGAGSQRKRLPSRKLERIVSRCLEADPQRRWQSVAEIARELSAGTGATRRRKRNAADVFPSQAGHPESHRSLKLTGKGTTIVLADFGNATGEPVFDGQMNQLLAVRLDHPPHLSLLPDMRVRQTLGMMGRPAYTALTPEVAAEICERTASSAVVEGSIASLGTEYALSLRARNCRTGEILGQEQARAATREDVFKALAQMAKRFAARVGESLRRVEESPSLPAQASTPSLEAWRSYSAAMKAIQARAQSAEIISLLKRATEIDPAFAMAFAVLGRLHSDLGESETGAHHIATAYGLRDSVSDREISYITFSYHRQVTRNLELARQILESWKHKDPGDLYPHGFLSGFVSPGSGHYDTAIEEGLKAIEIDPDFSIGYENVAWAYIYVNRLSDAEALLRMAAARKIEVIQFSLVRYAIAFLRGDKTAMHREATQRQGKVRSLGLFEHQEALTCANEGRLKEAARLSDRAVTLARQGGLLERAAQFAGARAVWSALVGNRAEAQTIAQAALSLCRSRDADYGPAFALAILQDSTQPRTVQADLETRYPQDTSVQFSYLPALRALDALNQDDPAKALELTQAAAPYDFAVPGTAFFTGALFGALYPVYVRGLAYLQLGRPSDAAAEFQKILDHPGLVSTDPIGSVARLQLGRALSASGDREKSAAVYEDLLARWKDADPDIPVLKQAKVEYARLQ